MTDKQKTKAPLIFKKETPFCEWCGTKTQGKCLLRREGIWEWVCIDCSRAYGNGLVVGRKAGKKEVREPIINALGIESKVIP